MSTFARSNNREHYSIPVSNIREGPTYHVRAASPDRRIPVPAVDLLVYVQLSPIACHVYLHSRIVKPHPAVHQARANGALNGLSAFFQLIQNRGSSFASLHVL